MLSSSFPLLLGIGVLFSIVALGIVAICVAAATRGAVYIQPASHSGRTQRSYLRSLITDVRIEVILNLAILWCYAGMILYMLPRLPNINWTEVTLGNLVGGVLACLVMNDVFYYPYHRMMHSDFFFRYVHHTHHEVKAPSGFNHTYLEHPSDFLVGTLCAVLPLAIVPLHLLAVPCILFSQAFLAVAYHSGRELKVPFVFSSTGHDQHHSNETGGNYSQNFLFMDVIFGTRLPESNSREEIVHRPPFLTRP